MKMKNNYFYNPKDNTCHLIIKSHGKQDEAIIDSHSLPGVIEHHWYFDGKGYVETKINGKNIRLHRYLMASKLSKNLEVDHISGDKLDNRIKNLRVVTHRQNMCNQRRQQHTASAYKGVSIRIDKYRKNPICAQIWCCGKKYHLGYFSTEEKAARAYDKKAIELFGEYAKLNSPLIERIITESKSKDFQIEVTNDPTARVFNETDPAGNLEEREWGKRG